MKYTTLFHISDTYLEEFSYNQFSTKDLQEKEPMFYWISERYYTHNWIKDYLYIFKEALNIHDFTLLGHGGYTEDKRWMVYEQYLQEKREPPILKSTKKMIPKIIAKYNKEINKFMLLKPENHKGLYCRLFEGQEVRGKHFSVGWNSISFLEIKEFMECIDDMEWSIPYSKNLIWNM